MNITEAKKILNNNNFILINESEQYDIIKEDVIEKLINANGNVLAKMLGNPWNDIKEFEYEEIRELVLPIAEYITNNIITANRD